MKTFNRNKKYDSIGARMSFVSIESVELPQKVKEKLITEINGVQALDHIDKALFTEMCLAVLELDSNTVGYLLIPHSHFEEGKSGEESTN